MVGFAASTIPNAGTIAAAAKSGDHCTISAATSIEPLKNPTSGPQPWCVSA
jgi:hypothetical protein